jgi:hypothetical protein
MLLSYCVGALLQAAAAAAATAAMIETAVQADAADGEEGVLPQIALSCYYTAAGTRMQVNTLQYQSSSTVLSLIQRSAVSAVLSLSIVCFEQ